MLKDGTDIVFRPYDFEEDPPRLVKHLFTSTSEQNIRDENPFFKEEGKLRVRLVAEIDGELHATLTLIREDLVHGKHIVRVFSSATSETHRGTGLSLQMMEYGKNAACELSIKIMLTDTWASNNRARAFYEKCGFLQYGVLPNGLPALDCGDDVEFEDMILFFMPLND